MPDPRRQQQQQPPGRGRARLLRPADAASPPSRHRLLPAKVADGGRKEKEEERPPVGRGGRKESGSRRLPRPAGPGGRSKSGELGLGRGKCRQDRSGELQFPEAEQGTSEAVAAPVPAWEAEESVKLEELESGKVRELQASKYDLAAGLEMEARREEEEKVADSDCECEQVDMVDPFCIPGSGVASCTTPSKPHKANDPNWEAMRAARSRDGGVGLSHFHLIRRLGCGDIGSVYLAQLRGSGCYFAMKVMDKGALHSRKKQERAQTEVDILQSLDHPFLPTLYAHLHTPQFSCLIMEFCPGGDLHSLRQSHPAKRFSNHAARFYAAEVLLALEYLHMMGVVYRDLKPENVLVRKDGHIMLSDFDLSLKCDVSPSLVPTCSAAGSILPALHHFSTSSPTRRHSFSSYNQHVLTLTSCIMPACSLPKLLRLRWRRASGSRKGGAGQVVPLQELVAEPTEARSMSFVGTHEYLAPEMVSGDGHGSAVDWWTFGIFLFELLYGRTPFRGADNHSTLTNVLSQPLRFPDQQDQVGEREEAGEEGGVCEAAKSLIRSLLVKDPYARLGSARGAAEIKAHPFFDSINWPLIRCAAPPQVPTPFRPPACVATVGGATPPPSPDSRFHHFF